MAKKSRLLKAKKQAQIAERQAKKALAKVSPTISAKKPAVVKALAGLGPAERELLLKSKMNFEDWGKDLKTLSADKADKLKKTITNTMIIGDIKSQTNQTILDLQTKAFDLVDSADTATLLKLEKLVEGADFKEYYEVFMNPTSYGYDEDQVIDQLQEIIKLLS